MTIKEKAAEILDAIKYRLTAPIVERNLESAMEWARKETIEQFKEYLEKKRQKIVSILEDITEEDARYFALYQRYVYLGIIINDFFKEEQK